MADISDRPADPCYATRPSSRRRNCRVFLGRCIAVPVSHNAQGISKPIGAGLAGASQTTGSETPSDGALTTPGQCRSSKTASGRRRTPLRPVVLGELVPSIAGGEAAVSLYSHLDQHCLARLFRAGDKVRWGIFRLARVDRHGQHRRPVHAWQRQTSAVFADVSPVRRNVPITPSVSEA
jgi:hypothetical protein